MSMATNLRGVRRGYADIGGGQQMYYETMGSGYPLILLHQSWWNSFEFEHVIPLLAQKYAVYAFDTLGFGFSPAAPEWWEFADFTDSVVRAMDALGITKAHFGGMHTGALLMADLDARHKERCDAMCYGGLAIYDEALRKKKYSFRRMIGQNQAPYVKVLQPGDVIGHEGALLQRKADGSHMIEYWMEQVRENPDSKLEYIQRAAMANLLHYDKGGADGLTVLLGFDLKRALKVLHAALPAPHRQPGRGQEAAVRADRPGRRLHEVEGEAVQGDLRRGHHGVARLPAGVRPGVPRVPGRSGGVCRHHRP